MPVTMTLKQYYRFKQKLKLAKKKRKYMSKEEIKVVINPTISWLRKKMKEDYQSEPTTLNKDWEIDFDNIFTGMFDGISIRDGANWKPASIEDVKSFISQLLLNQKEDI